MRLAFLDLPDDRVDLISLVRQDPQVEIVLVVHPDREALALKIAEVLQIPHSTEPLALLQLKPDQVALPSLDAPSAAALLRAGISERIFITLDDVSAGFSAARGETAPLEASPIDEWENLFDETTGGRLAPIREALALTDDRQRLFREILALAVEESGAESGSIMVLDEEEQELRIAFADGLSPDVVRTSRQKLGEGVAGTVARDGKPIILNERIADPRFRGGRDRSRIAAAMSVPIRIGERTIGVLNVSSDRPGATFTEEQLARLCETGDHISAILERVVRGMQRDLDAVEFRARHDIEQTFSREGTPLAERLYAAAVSLRDRFEAGAVHLHLLDEGDGRVETISSSAGPGETTRRSIEGGVLALALSEQRSYFLTARLSRPGEAGTEEAIPNLLVTPLTGTRPLGVLDVECLRRTESDLEDFTRLATRIASYLARAIERHLDQRDAARHGELFGELADAAARLMVARDVDALATEASLTLRKLFPGCLTTARLRDSTGGVLLHSAYGGPPGSEQRTAEHEGELTRRALEERREIVSPAGDAGRSRGDAEPPGAYAVTPIRLGDEVIGALGVVEATRPSRSHGQAGLGDLEMQALRKLALYVSLSVEAKRDVLDRPERSLNDPITGLLAAHGFEVRLQEEVKRSERYHERFLVTLCTIADYDRLRTRHGDPWAESLLKDFALALTRNVREVDAVAHLASGRFVVLSPATEKDHGALLKRLDALVPRLAAVQSLGPSDEVRMTGRQFTYPDEIPTRAELLALIRSDS